MTGIWLTRTPGYDTLLATRKSAWTSSVASVSNVVGGTSKVRVWTWIRLRIEATSSSMGISVICSGEARRGSMMLIAAADWPDVTYTFPWKKSKCDGLLMP